jgi:hypothetical protein
MPHRAHRLFWFLPWLSSPPLYGLPSPLSHPQKGVVRPLTLISAAAVAATPLANHLLIHAAGLGLNGAAVSTIAIHALQTALLLALAAWQNRAAPRGAKPWGGLSREAFSAVPSYLAVALPATGMMVGSWRGAFRWERPPLWLCRAGRAARSKASAWQTPPSLRDSRPATDPPPPSPLLPSPLSTSAGRGLVSEGEASAQACRC